MKRFALLVLGSVCLPLQLALPATSVLAQQSLTLTSRYHIAGDGKTDDSAALQAAINAGVGDLRLPRGIYRLSKTLSIDLDRVGYTSIHGGGTARLVMAGPGPAIRFVGTHFKSADPEGFEQRVWDRQRMPLVDGISIEGAHEQACGIEAVGTMQLTVTRTHIRGVLHAIHLRENNRNVIISDCHLYENRGVGVYYDDVNLHQSNITGCHISYNGGGGIVSTKGNVRNIHISGCDLESNMSPQTPPTANVLIDCRGGTHGTAEVAITGCTIQHNHQSPGSANIRIIGSSGPAPGRPDKQHEGHVTISGNVLSDVFENIHLQSCRGVVISGNTLWKGFNHNLLIEQCSNVVLGANSLDRNPRYGYGDGNDAKNRVVFKDSRDCTITGLHLNDVRHSRAALVLADCHRFNITGCSILDCDGVGMLLNNTSLTRVSGCTILGGKERESEFESIIVSGGKDNFLAHNLLDKQPSLRDTDSSSVANIAP